MEQKTIQFEFKQINSQNQTKNRNLKNVERPDTNIKLEANENNINNIPEIQPNKFISFITSKLGIAIIASSLVIIAVGVVLGVTLSGKKDENEDKLISLNTEESQKVNESDKENESQKVNESDKEQENENENDKSTDEVKDGNTEEEEKENEKDYIYKGKILSDTLYVKKVDNLPDDFILGMDLSSVIVEENSGVKYYNFNGEERDIFETLRYVGINYIRVRIWNDPYDSQHRGYGGGNNDMDTAIKIGKRVTKYKMKLLASFHYSDFYADPGRQFVPKAWRGLTLDEKVQKAKEFTIESLTRFKNEGIDVGMVALGNEINDFFCGEHDWTNICKILQACSEATRQVLPDTLISVHFTNPEREGSMIYFANSLNAQNLDYDVFSVSYYNVWAGGLECLNQLNDVANKYNKKIFIAETQYPYSRDNFDAYPNKTPGYDDYLFYPLTVQGQANHIRDLINHVVGIKNSMGIFYWEGAWIAVGTDYYQNLEKWEKYGSGWASSYSSSYNSTHFFGGGAATENQALFDSDGKPLESLKVFNLIKYGNEIETVEDGVEDISVNPIDFDSFVLPDKIEVIDTSNQTTSKNINWNEELNIAKAKNDVKYNYNGIADNIDVKCVFENNEEKTNRKFVCSYYIGDKFLSPLKLLSMIRIREK